MSTDLARVDVRGGQPEFDAGTMNECNRASALARTQECLTRRRAVTDATHRAALHATISQPISIRGLHHDKMQNDNKKVKFSHTRYRALGPELIPVYRQSARR